MKSILCLGMLWFSFSLSAQKITFSATDTPLSSVIKYLEQEHGLLCSYVEADIAKINISVQAKSQDITTFLTTILSDKALDFEMVGDNYIVLKKQEISPILSKICGQVVDEFSRNPLAYANVYLQRSGGGVYTDVDGNFYLECQLKEQDSIIISYVGYQEQSYLASSFLEKPCPLAMLPYTVIDENFIVVKEYLTNGIDLGRQRTATRLKPNQLGTMPGQVEPDILGAIHSLPGVNSPMETAADLHIRGGTPDQNLILWQDIPIYHSAHFFGQISAFNPYIIDEVQVYRSGFGAAYGERISGVIDLETNDFRAEKPSLGGGLNGTHTYFYGKIPTPNQRFSVVFSFRHSLAEVWQSPAFDKLANRALQAIAFGRFQNLEDLPERAILDSEFDFLDANLVLNYEIDPKNKLTFSALSNQNQFDNLFDDRNTTFLQEDSFDLRHNGVNLTWTHQWTPHFNSQLSGIYTDFEYDYGHRERRMGAKPKDESIAKNSMIQEQKVHWENQWSLPDESRLDFGYRFTNYQVSSSIFEQKTRRPAVEEGQDNQARLHAVFVEWSQHKKGRWGFDIGLRWNYFTGMRRQYLEPRLHVKYQLSKALDFHINAGKYQQFLSQVIELKFNRPTLLSNPIWVLAENRKNGNSRTPVLGSNQLQLGMVYHKNGWVVDLQAYLKRITGLTTSAVGFDPLPRNGYDQGTSDVKGLDVLIKKRWRNYRTWMSYSLSKVDYLFEDFAVASFAGTFDQRHCFSFAHILEYKNWEFSLGWSLNSGIPYSEIVDFSVVENQMQEELIEPIFGGLNAENLPWRHRLDASVMYHFPEKRNSNWKGVIGVAFQNIYDKKNIYSREYFIDLNEDISPIQITEKSAVRFIPNVVVRFEF